MQVNQERARAQAQLYVAHYRRGLSYAVTQNGSALTHEDASDMRIANYHAIHARGAVRDYVSAEIDALQERRSAAKHHLGLSPTELGIINDAFWEKVSAAIGLDEKDIRADVERMDRIAQLSSVYQNLLLAQHYEGKSGEERFAVAYVTESRKLLEHLKASGDDYSALNTKELSECVVTIIAFEQMQLQARPRKPTGEFRIYGQQAHMRAEA